MVLSCHFACDPIDYSSDRVPAASPLLFSWLILKPRKVYEALHLITARDIKGAAELLLECVSTFTCTELCSYNDFILYTVVTNVLSLPRTTLKKKIVDGPEVNSPHIISYIRNSALVHTRDTPPP